MRSFHPISLAAAILVSMSCAGGHAQSTKPPDQPLVLRDPTPRPPDLEKQYSTDPVEQARQEQLATIRAAQIRQQVVAATDKLIQLTQSLETEVAKRQQGATMTPQVVEAEQIEKLAKTVKDRTKAQ